MYEFIFCACWSVLARFDLRFEIIWSIWSAWCMGVGVCLVGVGGLFLLSHHGHLPSLQHECFFFLSTWVSQDLSVLAGEDILNG
jgi:hypothetical protein